MDVTKLNYEQFVTKIPVRLPADVVDIFECVRSHCQSDFSNFTLNFCNAHPPVLRPLVLNFSRATCDVQ